MGVIGSIGGRNGWYALRIAWKLRIFGRMPRVPGGRNETCPDSHTAMRLAWDASGDVHPASAAAAKDRVWNRHQVKG